MTWFGINPSFVGPSGRLPMFRNLLFRAKMFEAFRADGYPTGEPAEVGADGWVGVRLFVDMPEGQFPKKEELLLTGFPPETRVRVGGNGLVTICWRGPFDPAEARVEWVGRPVSPFFDGPSMVELAKFRPAALRTLDWSRVNDHLPGHWDKPDVTEEDLQGGERGASVHLQARAARLLRAHLWYNVTPRLGAEVEVWHARLRAQFEEIEATVDRPPVLELGNEPWNDRISWWSRNLRAQGKGWERVLAAEIVSMATVAQEVFGPAGVMGPRWFLYVGGHIADPVGLGRIVDLVQAAGVKVDLAGPACYVGPTKEAREDWVNLGREPDDSEMLGACLNRLEEVEDLLMAHRSVLSSRGPRFACYEAGQSMNARADVWRPAALRFQRSAECGTLYRNLRVTLERTGIELANWYSVATSQTPPAPVDPFGLLEGCGMPELPKAKAAKGE